MVRQKPFPEWDRRCYLFRWSYLSLLHGIMVMVGITGNALPADIDFFVSSGADQVVTKPLSRAKLLEALYHLAPTAMASEEDGGWGARSEETMIQKKKKTSRRNNFTFNNHLWVGVHWCNMWTPIYYMYICLELQRRHRVRIQYSDSIYTWQWNGGSIVFWVIRCIYVFAPRIQKFLTH